MPICTYSILPNPYITMNTPSLRQMAEWLYLYWKHMKITGRISLVLGSIVIKGKSLPVLSRLDYSLFHHIHKMVNDALGSKNKKPLFYLQTLNHVLYPLRLWTDNR